MPRYFFNIKNGDDRAEDTIGTELPDIEAARKKALGAARNRMADRIQNGQLLGDDEFAICNAVGKCLLTIPYRSALQLD